MSKFSFPSSAHRSPVAIANDGPRLTATNYWRSSEARAGACFLSWNAGAARLLVPAARVTEVADALRTVKGAAVTRGRWHGYDAYEVLLDDGTDEPWCLHLVATQSSDRLIPAAEAGRAIQLVVYAPAPSAPEGVKVVAQLPARFRVATSLPDLRPWDR